MFLVKKVLEVYGASYRVYASKCSTVCQEDPYVELKYLVFKIPANKHKLALSLLRSIISS